MPSTHPVLGSDVAALTPWVELIDLAVQSTDRGALIRLDQRVDAPDEIDLGLLPLDELHPAELLEGFEAPPECIALGLVTGGWAAPMFEGRPSRHPARRRVTNTVLIDRAGNVAGRLRWDDGTTLDEPPADGELLRLLRVAMGVI